MNGEPPRNIQAELMERHVRRAEEVATAAVSSLSSALWGSC